MCAVDSFGIPHPGCFAKRVWICLIAKELTFLETPKSPQNTENMRFATETLRHRGRKLMKTKVKWRVASDEWGDRAQRTDEKTGFATETPRQRGGQTFGRKWSARRHMGLGKKEGRDGDTVSRTLGWRL